MGLMFDVIVIGNVTKTLIYRTYCPEIKYDNLIVNINLNFKIIKDNING